MVNEAGSRMQEICLCYVKWKSIEHMRIENGILQEMKSCGTPQRTYYANEEL